MKKLLLTFLVALTGGNVAMAQDTRYVVAGEQGVVFNNDWSNTDTNYEMTKDDDGFYRFTKSNVTISSGTTIYYKIVEYGKWENAYGMYNNDNTMVNAWYYVANGGTFDVTFIFNPDKAINGSNKVDCKLNGNMYILTSADGSSWSVGDAVSPTGGVYTASVETTENMLFALAPSSAILDNAVKTWDGVARPVADNNYELYLSHYEGTTISCAGNVWKAKEPATYILTYNSNDNTFSCDAQKVVSFGSTGWATYSGKTDQSNYGYTISNADAFYVSSTSEGKAILTSISSDAVIPTAAGIMVHGTSNGTFTMKTTGTDGTELTNNMLVGTGTNTDYKLWRDGQYVLKEVDGVLGFYMVDVTSDDKILASHKAYLETNSSGVRSFISLGSESTGINSVAAGQVNSEVYNLNGQRVALPQKGLYIVGGKKVMMK